MSNIDKQALRGQSVEGSFYLAECGHCGEMYPSNKLNGGEPLFSGDYGECFCHLCGADDTDIADCGAWGSEGVTAWNYQQKRIEALLDELEAKEKRIAELEAREVNGRFPLPKDSSQGWKIDPEFISKIQDAIGHDEECQCWEGSPSMEMVEVVLIAAAAIKMDERG